MPKQNSDKKERTPAVPLRRSPRFLQIVLADPENPKTPKPEPRRRTRVPSSATPLNSTGNVKVSTRCRTLRSNSNKSLQTLDESCNAAKGSHSSKSRSRKSARPPPSAEECTGEKFSRSSKWSNREPERKATLRSCSRDVDTNAKKTCNGGFTGNTGDDCSLTAEFVNTSKKSKGSLLKNRVQNSKKIQEENLAFDDNSNTNKGVSLLSITENSITTPSIAHNEPTNKKYINKNMQKNIGEKRKRNQIQGNAAGVTHNWTKDQESALERAYFEAKPTPHFWKKVSKLVPGKSAQECFDKVHGSHLTPPPPRLRSRARVIPNSKDSSLSASKFLNSSSSPVTKKPKSRKQKSHVIQRTVRNMLQNQYNKGGQDSGSADLFSVLEPTFKQSAPCNPIITTPVRHVDMEGGFKRCSVTAQKKSLSRFSGAIVSPPVLKQVKNKALHDKYIDQLNCREAGRKMAGRKCNIGGGEEAKLESSVQRKDALKAAKNALVFGARDAINEFECKQGKGLIDAFEDECVVVDDDDDDGGQVLF